MSRIFIIVVLIGVVVIGVGGALLGAFPPNPAPHPVQKVLPNDRFQTR